MLEDTWLRNIEAQRGRFLGYAGRSAQGMSPFYGYIWREIAKDDELLAIASLCQPEQPSPLVLVAAVRLLLDRGESPELFALYPTSFESKWSENVYPHFRKFVLDNKAEIEALVKVKRVQTNVVRRSAVLVPGLIRSSGSFDDVPFANIEIGASAGLTLYWKNFRYSYVHGDRQIEVGLPGLDDSAHVVESKLVGDWIDELDREMPNVVTSIGIEIEPLDVDDQESMDWLRALGWPEHEDNRKLFDIVLEMARAEKPDIRSGDATKLVPVVVDELPGGMPVNVYHSHVLYQFTPEAREEFDEMLAGLSLTRHVNRLGLEASTAGYSALELVEFRSGKKVKTTELARCEAHGRWIDWGADARE